MICKHFLDNIFNKSEPIFFSFARNVKWFQVFLSNTNDFIYNKSFFRTQLIGLSIDM